MASVLNDPKLEALLDTLHAQSAAQEPGMHDHFRTQFEAGKTISFEEGETRAFFATQYVALEKDKSQFCYQLCRALGAQRVVEAGTSFGVSTLYLAAAVRDNGGGSVIGTEYEAGKAAIARETWKKAGLSEFIELREGDLRETLKTVEAPIDFMLVDIWTDMAAPALALIAPRLRQGAIVICDNTESFRGAYADYFKIIETGGFRTMTLPFTGGLEMSVKV